MQVLNLHTNMDLTSFWRYSPVLEFIPDVLGCIFTFLTVSLERKYSLESLFGGFRLYFPDFFAAARAEIQPGLAVFLFWAVFSRFFRRC